MSKSAASDHEAVFAAAAHHLIACRDYLNAITVLRACHSLQHGSGRTPELLEKLDTVRDLGLILFSDYRFLPTGSSPALEPLRKALQVLERQLTRDLRLRGVRVNTIYDFLRILERRPAAYLGHPSVLQLFAFLNGMHGRHPRFSRERPSFWVGFHEWIHQRHPGGHGGGGSWADTLAAAVDGDGPDALALFFRELRAYRRSGPTRGRPPKPGSRR